MPIKSVAVESPQPLVEAIEDLTQLILEVSERLNPDFAHLRRGNPTEKFNSQTLTSLKDCLLLLRRTTSIPVANELLYNVIRRCYDPNDKSRIRQIIVNLS